MKFSLLFFAFIGFMGCRAAIVGGPGSPQIAEPNDLNGDGIIDGEETPPEIPVVQIPGPQGDVGPGGPQGDAGAAGPQGETGIQGPQGDIGAQGFVGPQGDIGPQGVAGFQGPQGFQGGVGPQGSTGPQGNAGAQGPKGATGSTGAPGSQGNAGSKGDKGDVGIQGPPGTGFSNTSVLSATRTYGPVTDYPGSVTTATPAVFVPKTLKVADGEQKIGYAYLDFGTTRCTYVGNNKSGEALALYTFVCCQNENGDSVASMTPGKAFAFTGTITLTVGSGASTSSATQVVAFLQIQP